MENPFDVRRQKDPQGVIDDLVSCMTRQGKVIGEKDKEIERLSSLLVEAGIDPQKPPEPKKKGGRKKKEETPSNASEMSDDSKILDVSSQKVEEHV